MFVLKLVARSRVQPSMSVTFDGAEGRAEFQVAGVMEILERMNVGTRKYVGMMIDDRRSGG